MIDKQKIQRKENVKIFIRTENEDGTLDCSWYDKNRKRYKKETAWVKHNGLSIRETDDKHGFMGYARNMGFMVVDNFVGEHPKRVDSHHLY